MRSKRSNASSLARRRRRVYPRCVLLPFAEQVRSLSFRSTLPPSIMPVIGPMHLYSAPWLCQLIVLPSECDDELVSSDLGPGGSPADMALTLAYSMKSLLILLAITMPAAVAQQDTSIQLTHPVAYIPGAKYSLKTLFPMLAFGLLFLGAFCKGV